jgi:uncharacterized membrane protein
MRGKIKIFFVLLFFSIFGVVFSQDHFSEKIKNFDVEIRINKDSSFLVKESIVYDFGKNLKHGIYREIPLKNIKIKVLKVVDEFDNPYPFKTTKEGDSLKIKIGNPEKLITGQHTYTIFYQVFRGLGFFSDHDELYWNVTGNEWEVPIEKSQVLIFFPEKIPAENLKLDCFTGYFGSKEKDCDFKINKDDNIIFESKRNFSPREGFTIVLGWPKGIIDQPSIFQKLLLSFESYWPFLIPIFVFGYLFKEWWEKGKDPKIKKPIVVQYEPPNNLRPAEVDLIMNQKVQPKDIAATLLDLAVRGFIKIRQVKMGAIFKEDYELIKLKDADETLSDYERELLSVVPSQGTILLSSLKKDLSFSKIIEIMDKVYFRISSLEYFLADPKKVVRKWSIVGMAIIFISFIFLFNFFYLFLSLLTAGILFLIFSLFMPKRTEKGTEVYWQLLGFKEYINTAEKYRAQFYEKEDIFEKYLPYAVVFGLTKKWARAFEGIYQKPPSWYEGEFGPKFSTLRFADSIDRSFLPFVSSSGGRSGFVGSGSSGGGRGGGGGGSW